jgi:fructoselysine-6-P-deglycase FrlB-like protein
MSITIAEIRTQPDLWQRAGALAADFAHVLPAAGERVCVIGCGTSLFMAQSWAAMREAAGQGVTDAFPASEVPPGRRYDVMLAISRSGTTSEVAHALQNAPAARTIVITTLMDSPVAALAGHTIDFGFADEESVVQTRFATTTLAFLRAAIHPEATEAAVEDARRALQRKLPLEPAEIEQWTFLGRGWTVGLAQEAALKLREACQAWTEAYPAFEYRHGPIAIAAPGRAVWSFGPLDPGIAEAVRAAGATVVAQELDPLASLVAAQRVAVALAEARGLDPDHPRNLSRSVVLSDGELEVLAGANA